MDPKEVLNNPENVKLLINLLQSLLPNEQTEEIKTAVNPPAKTKQPSKIKTKGRQRKSTENEIDNKFASMPEFSMHKEDSSIDKKLSKHPPVARMREFDPVEVVCRVCGKKEIVSPGLVFEGAARYKCNNCSTQAG